MQKRFPLWVLEICGAGYYFYSKQECIDERERRIKSGFCIAEECIIYFESELLREIVK